MRLQRVALRHSPPWKEPVYRLLPGPPQDARLEFAERIDWRRQVVLLAHRGECPTGGYGVRITGVREDGGRLRVEILLRDPGPGEFVTMVMTYPADAAVLPRSRFKGQRITVVFEAGGRELGSQVVDL